jgi:protein CpxP
MLKAKAVPVPHRGSMLMMRLLALGVFIALAGAGISAHAQGHGRAAMDGGMMMFDGPPGHPGRGVAHMLDGLNATDVQRSQIRQIATAASADLKAQREARRALREKGIQILAAPSVDAGAAEALRQQMLAQHDQASKRMLQAMLDVANVLTPEQRAKLGERMKKRQAVMNDRMQRMHREHVPQPPAPK